MFHVIFKLKDFFNNHRKTYIVSAITMILSNILRVYLPFIIGQVIDEIITNQLTTEKLYFYVLLFVLSTLFIYLLEFTWLYYLFTGAAKLQRDMREDLMKHFLKMRAVFFEKFRVGDLMARSTQDVQSIAETAGYGMMILMDSTMFLIIIVLMMSLTVSWQLILFSFLPLVILAYLFGKAGNLVEQRYTISQEAFSSLNNDVLEVVDGIRVIRAYVKEDSYINKFRRQTENLLNKNNKVAEINAVFMPLVKVFTAVSTIISFGYGAILVANNELSVGDIVAFQMYLQMIVWPIVSIGELTNILRQGSASMLRVEEVLKTGDDMEENGQQVIKSIEDIKMEHLNFKYPLSAETNLNDLTVQIPKGKMLGIVGKTGGGKTTFLRQLLRQYPLGKGIFQYGEEDMVKLQRKDLQALIGYVPQDHILFSKSVRDNIAFGKENATPAEIMESIRLASFESDLSQMEEGLDTLVGEKGISISGGQKQRISLARALIKDPEILILDDSLSAVDSKTEQNIIENIKTERHNKTTIITTHRLSAIKEADEIIVLEDGQIVERGTHEELIALRGWYYEQYTRQELKAGDE